MICLITTEAAIFVIFLVAYIFYLGKSLSGPSPRDVLELPILTTICLLSSSFTVHRAVGSLRRDSSSRCALWLAGTVLLGSIFLAGTAKEWYGLIYVKNLTIRTNLFGTTFYSLVGLHCDARHCGPVYARAGACLCHARQPDRSACQTSRRAFSILALRGCRMGGGIFRSLCAGQIGE